MATVNFYRSGSTSSGSYVLGKIDYSYTQSTSNNTSTITFTVYIKKGNDNLTLTESTSGTFRYKLNINGEDISGSKSLSILTSFKEIGSFTRTIQHDSNGSKNVSISGYVYLSDNTGSAYYGLRSYVHDDSDPIKLTTIPRASSLTSAAAITLSENGSACNVKWTPLATTFRYKLKFTCGSKSVTIPTDSYITPKTTSAYTYTGYSMKISDWASAMPKTYTGTCTVTLYTYTDSSTTAIGSSSKTFTLTLPSSIKPKISFTTASGVDTWTASDGNIYYLQGISKYKLAATFTAGTGSYISSCSISGTGLSYSKTGSTSTSSITSGDVQSSALSKTGTQTYTAKVTDGRTSVTSTKTITVYAYSKPTVSLSAVRTSTSGSVKLTYTASCSSVNSQNYLYLLRVYKKLSTDQTWTSVSAIDLRTPSHVISKSDSMILTGFDSASSYDFKVQIVDARNNSNDSATASVASEFRILNISANKKGIAFGKMAEEDNLFDCKMPIKIAVTSDASGTAQNKVPLRIGLDSAQHVDFDNNEIQAKENDTTPSPLHLNNDGGHVYIGSADNGGDLIARNSVIAPYGRFVSTTDASQTAQNTVALRVGSASGEHLDIDGNEIIAKDSSTTVGTLSLAGAQVDLYVDAELTLRAGKDETSKYIKSTPTYNRTYNGSSNMYITENGVFGRSTSSSMRYKTNIIDVTNEDLDPYRILQIPVRQYQYVEPHVPIGTQADDVYIGLIAEEVASAYPVAAEYTDNGQVEMWNIKVLFPALLKIVQDQQIEINNLKNIITNIVDTSSNKNE